MKYLYKIGLILSVVLTAGASPVSWTRSKSIWMPVKLSMRQKWILLTYVLDIIG